MLTSAITLLLLATGDLPSPVNHPSTPEERRAFLEEGARREGVPGPLEEDQRIGQLALESRMPAYPHRVDGPNRVANQLDAHGLTMYVQTFSTHDDPHQVMDFFKAAFKQTNLPVLGNGDLWRKMPYPSVTVFDQINGVDLSVVAIPDAASHLTLVVESLSDFRAYEQRMGQAEASRYGSLPPYPTGIGPSTVASNDEARRTETVLFTTRDPAEKVVDYYRAELGAHGFLAQEEPGSDAQSREVTFTSPGQTWHVLMSPGANGTGTRVMATSQSSTAVDAQVQRELGP